MKLLFVLPDNPVPPRKGYRLLAYQHIRGLARAHSVDVVHFGDAGGLEDCCRRIWTVPRSRWAKTAGLARALLNYEPFQVGYYRSAAMARAVAQTLHEGYDAAVFQLTRMAQFRPTDPPCPTVLNMIDPYSLSYERSLGWRSSLSAPWVRTESARLLSYERLYAPRFDRVLLTNDRDVADYEALLPGARFGRVPHGVDVEGFAPPPPTARRDGAVVVTGNMGYPPNAHGVTWFCAKVWPLVKAAFPAARLSIVGTRPSSAVHRSGAAARAVVTGDVPDVRPYLHEARVSVCPVHLAAGTQTKILEAMATGTPVVTTSAGNHGLGATDGRHLHVADDPPAFADRIIRLLRGEGWEALSTEARRWVVERHAWAVSVRALEDVLAQVSESRRTRAAGGGGLKTPGA